MGNFKSTYNIQRNNTALFPSQIKNFQKKINIKKKLRRKKSSCFLLQNSGYLGPSKTSVLEGFFWGTPVVGRPRHWIIEPLQDRFILHRIQPESPKTHKKNVGDPNVVGCLFVPKIKKKQKHHMVYCIYIYIKGYI